MPFQKPDNDVAFAATQSIWYSPEIDILAAGFAGDGVISGCAVTAQGTPDMTVAVAAGVVRIGGVLINVAGGNVTITTANATNPRIDLVVVNNSSTKSAAAGTAAANPKMPAIPANSVALADVTIPANDTTIASNQITDKRVMITAPMLGSANAFTGKQTIGSGDQQTFQGYAIASALHDIAHGTVASPISAVAATARISRTQAITRAALTAATAAGADGAEVVAALAIDNVGTASDQVQPVGVYVAAENAGTYTGTGTGNDACALYANARIKGSGVGVAIGGAFYPSAESATSSAMALEIGVGNSTGADVPYSATGWTQMSGVWINALGGNDSGVGIQFGNTAGRQFDVGIGIPAHLTGGKTGGIKNASFRDDGNSVTVFDINGNHTYGVDTVGAGFSGAPIRLGNNTSIAWRNAANSADVAALRLDTSNRPVVGLLTFQIDAAQTWKTIGASFALGPLAANAATADNGWLAIGGSAGAAVTTGTNWVALGTNSGLAEVTGSNWIAIGNSAGRSNTVSDWIAIGPLAGYTNVTGTAWTAIGSLAGNLATASNWVAIGHVAGQVVTTGANWTSVGSYSGYSNTTGSDWVALGFAAGLNNVTGSRNIFLGANAGYNETGSDKLYIEPTNSARPLIFGDFAADTVTHYADPSSTNTILAQLTLDRGSSGTPAAGMGNSLLFALESSTTAAQSAASIDVAWATATHASRKARLTLNAWDTAAREVLRGEADGSNPMIGFLGASAVVRPAATDDLRTALINLGLYATGGASPLNLNGGALTVGQVNIAASGYASHAGIAGDPGSPAAGDIWYNTTQKAHRFRSTAGTGGLVGLLKAQTSIAGGDTIATTASETNFATNYAIPANGLTVGKTIYVYASGVYGTLGSGTVTLNLKVKMGTTVLLNSAVITTAVSIAARFWKVEAYLTVTAAGASGALECRGEFRIPTANSDVGFSSPGIGGDATVTVDTTASQTVQISAQHGASSASNTIKMREFIVLELD